VNAKFHHLLDVIRHNLSDLGGLAIVVLLHRIRQRLRRSAIESFQVQETLNKEGNTMVKAYDIKDLLERCKANGLELVEEEAKIFAHNLFAWLSDSAKLSEMPYDDFIALGYPKAEEFIQKLADKINPADNA